MENLILKAKTGDEKSIEEILRNFEPLINNTSLSFYICGYDSEDIKQLAKLSIIRAIKTFDIKRGYTFPSYAKVCVRHEMYKEIEKAEKIYYREKESKEIAKAFDIREIKDESINLQEDFIKKQENEILALAINTLEEEERTLLNNIYIKGYTLVKFSESIDLEYYKARYMKEKALKKLRRILEEVKIK